jgi:uncharacterized protein (UPF0210 family)
MSEIYDALREVQDRCEGHVPPENGGAHTPTVLEETLHQAKALLRFSADLQSRMSEVGVNGIGGVLSLYSQLRSAIDKVALHEIDASAADVARLVETMQHLRDELQRMKALKLTLDTTP